MILQNPIRNVAGSPLPTFFSSIILVDFEPKTQIQLVKKDSLYTLTFAFTERDSNTICYQNANSLPSLRLGISGNGIWHWLDGLLADVALQIWYLSFCHLSIEQFFSSSFHPTEKTRIIVIRRKILP